MQITCRPALDAVRTWDSPDTLIYCDPPYVHETRHEGSRDIYGVEMSEQDHRELAATLKACRAKVVLSGYPSPLYDELYANWRRVTFDIANHAAGGRTKARKQETLWLNWQEPCQDQPELGLFARDWKKTGL